MLSACLAVPLLIITGLGVAFNRPHPSGPKSSEVRYIYGGGGSGDFTPSSQATAYGLDRHNPAISAIDSSHRPAIPGQPNFNHRQQNVFRHQPGLTRPGTPGNPWNGGSRSMTGQRPSMPGSFTPPSHP